MRLLKNFTVGAFELIRGGLTAAMVERMAGRKPVTLTPVHITETSRWAYAQ
jgi:hypothetical protein